MITINLALAGLGIGAVASLCGLGVLVTYRLTGVVNVGFGAIAMLAAYVAWQAVQVWHWPIGLVAPLDIVVFCPALGLALERCVYRPLQRRDATAAEHLVASIGVLVVVLGAAVIVWGGQTRLDAPSLVPTHPLHVAGGLVLLPTTVLDVVCVVIVALVVMIASRTRAGLVVRAAVDERELAELNAINTDRVAALGWMGGAALAGLGGILLAPTLRLDPYGLTLVVLETMAVVVVARFARPVLAVVTGVVVGIVQAELVRVQPTGRLAPFVEAVRTNLFVVALLGAVVVLRRLDERASTVFAGAGASSRAQAGPGAAADAGATGALAARRRLPALRSWWLTGVVLLSVPFLLDRQDLRTALAFPALAIVLLSIVLVSGYSGQVSLGQAGFAGLGALIGARLIAGTFVSLPAMPAIAAIVVTPLVVAPFGLLCGAPAIRRRGLHLALTTFAVGAAVSRFVFDQPVFVGALTIRRPSTFASDGNFYVLELCCLGASLVLVRNLHYDRLGRALVAVRDDEAGAQACGVDVRRIKLLVFAASAGLAALGGLLSAMAVEAFDANGFDPLRSLLWFSAVVVFGLDSAPGAVLGAAALVALDSTLPQGSSTLAIGAAAVLLGRLPGGLLHSLRRLANLVARRVRHGEAASPITTGAAPQLSARGRALAARIAQARSAAGAS